MNLQDLKPLPKPHLWWPFQTEFLGNAPALREIMRLSGSAGVGEWTSDDQLRAINGACGDVEASTGARPVIAANFSPFNVRRGTDPESLNASYFERELDAITGHLGRFKKHLSRVDWVLIDSESFVRTAPPAGRSEKDQQAAILMRHNAVHGRIVKACPDAKVVWYGNGQSMIHWRNGYGRSLNLAGAERGYPCHSPVMYQPHLVAECANLLKAQPDDGKPIIPWISITGGLVQGKRYRTTWTHTLDADLDAYWNLGARVNHPFYTDTAERCARFGPWGRVEAVIMYRDPYRDAGFAQKFGHYVCGAHHIEADADVAAVVDGLRGLHE